MKDETSSECFICGRLFTTFRRKHHCRICGQIFCSACTTLISGEKFNHNGKMRVCKTCLSFANDYNDSSDESSIVDESYADRTQAQDIVPTTSNAQDDLHSLHPETPQTDGKSFLTAPTPPPRLAIPATRKGESVEIPVSRSFNSKNVSLHTANFGRRKTFDRPSHYTGSYRASEEGATNSTTNLNTSSNLTINNLNQDASTFADYVKSHRFSGAFNFNNELTASSTNIGDDSEPPKETKSITPQHSDSEDEISMSIYSALHLDRSDAPESSSIEPKNRVTRSNTRSMDRAQASLYRMRNRRKSKSASRPQIGLAYSSSHLNSDLNHTITSQALEQQGSTLSDNLKSVKTGLNDVCEMHFKNLLKQDLEDEMVPEVDTWTNVLVPVLQQVENVQYNVKTGDNMDIRQYVKLKRLEGGKPRDTKAIDGVIFSKTFALKSMPKKFENPRIALIMFPLEYQKSGQHFMSLEPVINQEKEFIHKLVGRILALNPDVLLVGASVSGLALKLLDEANIAVAYNVKPQVIERVARLTQADIAISMDKLALNLRLGICSSLSVKTFAYKNITKTMIFINGCDHRLGCTLLLRGGDGDLLRKVKETAEFMVYAVCNLQLETALYRDSFVYLSQNFYNTMRNKDFKPLGIFGDDFLELFYKRILSSSPTVELAPPYLLMKAREIALALKNAVADRDNLSSQEVLDSTLGDLKKFLVDAEVSAEETDRIARSLVDRKIQLLEERFSIRKRQWDLFSSFSPDMLDPQKHQSITFLYSMVSSKNATPCVGPSPLTIDYYWDNDMTLGQYVDHLISSSGNICSEGCGGTQLHHYRTYVHGNAKVDIMVEPFTPRTPIPQNVLLTWSYCKQCGHTSPFLPMSDTTWKFSFGKFLELFFWTKKNATTNLGNCSHDFSKDHIKYFTYNELTVRMEYSTVDLLELITPRPKLNWKPKTNVRLKIELRSTVMKSSEKFFNSVMARLNRVKVDSISTDKMEEGQKRIEQLKKKATEEQDDVKKQIVEIYNSTDPGDHLRLNSVLRFVQDLSVEWDAEFAIFEANYLPTEKDIARITALQLKKLFLDNSDEKRDDADAATKAEGTDAGDAEKETEKNTEKNAEKEVETEKPTEKEKIPVTTNEKETGAEPLSEKNKYLEQPSRDVQERKVSSSSAMSHDSAMSFENKKISPKQGKVFEEVHRFEKLLEQENDSKTLNAVATPATEVVKPASITTVTPTTIPKSRQSSGGEISHNGRVKAFERNVSTSGLSSGTDSPLRAHPKLGFSASDLEDQLKEGRSKSFPNVAGLVTSRDSKVMKLTSYFDQIHFETLSKEFEMQREKERLKLIQNRYKAVPVSSSKPIVEIYKNVKDAVNEDELEASAVDNSDTKSAHESELSVSAGKQGKELEPGFKEDILKNEIPQTERVSLMKTLANFWADRSATLWKPLEYPLSSSEHIFVDSDVIVRDDEPSSLIAFCLSTSDYAQKIDTSQDRETVMLKKTAVHLKYQFQDGDTQLSCKIFFAEQFDAFRRTCGLDENFIQSLSRCVKWDSSGGKSGSVFLKTLDDRLVIKELSSSELDSFVKFASSYFEYMAQALFHDLPTAIAKIFGFYQINMKNPYTGKVFRANVLIMENLFFDRKNLRIFDLKGSMRNRHVQKTGKENEVLLDENMVEYIYESPLFVREYDKKLLRASLWNDTLFLAKMNVMDYSLVIGIDDENKTLTAGIIDCIRTFTWDKKLESWVKEKGLVGGSTKLAPTIVTPRQYKNRFREAMDRYILMVPDSWYQGSAQVQNN